MNFAITTVVCATDLSSESRGAETAAVLLAQKNNANLEFLTCDESYGDTFSYAMEMGAGFPEPVAPKNYERISETLDKAIRNHVAQLAPHFPPHKLKVKVRFGSTASVVLEEIKDLKPQNSILVVGKRHKGKIEKILLGSVSQRIITRSRIPVLVVPENASISNWPSQNIVAASSCRPGSREAEEMAANLAAQFHLPLHLVHVFEPPQPYVFLEPQIAGAGGFDFVDYAKLDEQMRHQRLVDLQNLQTFLSQTARPVSTTLKSGVVVDELLQFVTLQHSGLLVVGSHSGGGLKRFFLGGKTIQIIQLCAIPVLIVRHHDYAINEH